MLIEREKISRPLVVFIYIIWNIPIVNKNKKLNTPDLSDDI